MIQMHIIPLLLYLLVSPSLLLRPHWGVPYDQLTDEERTQAELQILLHGMQVPLERGQAAVLQPFSGTSLEDSDEGKSYRGQNFNYRTWLFTLLEKKNGLMCNFILIRGL